QFVHVTDLLPTLLGLVGVERPATWRGQPALELAGEDLGAALFDAGAAGRTKDVVIENEGHRGYRRGQWEAVTRHEAQTKYSEEPWELYDMSLDPTQVRDLSADEPDRLAELIEAWDVAAWENQ